MFKFIQHFVRWWRVKNAGNRWLLRGQRVSTTTLTAIAIEEGKRGSA